jgi:hypothetical protein
MQGRRLGFAIAIAATTTAAAAQQTLESIDPVVRIGEYVEQYYGRAQSIVTEETVTIQPLRYDLAAEGFPRRATYELRVEWDPSAANPDERATVVRQLLKATGPTLFAPGEEQCADPPSTTPEPLAFLLPANQAEWRFVLGRPDRVDGRTAMTVQYTRRGLHPPQVVSDHDCLFADLSGQTAGRLWVDPVTAEILRLDEHLVGMIDVRIPRELQKRTRPTAVTYERMNSSTRYKRVAFSDPDEVLLLPASMETLVVHRSDRGASRLRTTQTFTKYRRFVTSSRVLP